MAGREYEPQWHRARAGRVRRKQNGTCIDLCLRVRVLQRGLVITADGQYHLIQPAALDADQGMHVVHKRSAVQIEQIMQKTCLFDARDDPLPIESDPSLTANKDRLPVVRVSLFAMGHICEFRIP